MNHTLAEMIKKNRQLSEGLFKGVFGIEKEHVRVNNDGVISSRKHPEIFENKLNHPFITTDFSESQVELITPIFDQIDQAYYFLETLTEVFGQEIEGEYLWPQSAPPILPAEEEIPVAIYDHTPKGIRARDYREHLSAKYGKKKQTISGLHYNFSFDEGFLKNLYSHACVEGEYRYFKDNVYLKISRNFIRYAWLITYLFGASPGTDLTYIDICTSKMPKTAAGDPYFEYATSMRNGICGYRNHNNYIVSYDSVDQYIKELKTLIHDNKIKDEREYYSPVRLKTHTSSDFMTTLEKEGILYIEIRALDLDPLHHNGVSLQTLEFMHLFLVFILFKEEDCFGAQLHELSLENYEAVAAYGREPDLMLGKHLGKSISMKAWGLELLEEMQAFLKNLGCYQYDVEAIMKEMFKRMADVNATPSGCVLKKIKEEGYISWHMEQARAYKEALAQKPYVLKGCEMLELSTQILIKDAIKRGISIELLDKAENFVLLKQGDHKEYIKQATKTALDSYATFLIMENKVVTKEILRRENISVPSGGVYDDLDEAIKAYGDFSNKAFVIKPKSTNFGIGITIFKNGASYDDYLSALNLAFSHDQTVLVEDFVEGKEYRFFVIGDEVVGILHRVPANVIGDGSHTIEELVHIKNQDVLRGKGYKTPLEKIVLGQVETMFLKEQGLFVNSVIPKEQLVFLRENSNVSTGGDSIDFTEDMANGYKQIAIASAKAVGATICGVDMMIKDIYDDQGAYAIIELNFNPAIHIHCYPYKGKNRDLGNRLLDVLGFPKNP